MMGAFNHLLLLITGVVVAVSATGLLSSSSLVPQDLLHYFHPQISEELRVWPGVVERQRREVGDPDEVFGQDDEVVAEVLSYKEQEVNEEVNTFRISKKIVDEAGTVQEEMCIFHRTRADFTINFETRPGAPVSIASKAYEMPNKPMMPDAVNGTCALKTETSAIFIFWAGFNLTFEFVKNPEGNSYYMNRVILIYDTEHPSLKKDFEYANTHGKIHLETRPGKNFFFTPLGKAYLCYKAENQGPLKLWNVAKNQIEGEISLSDTKFQPFVVRAHGQWGETKRCLPLKIRQMREDFWPFVSACAVVVCSCLLIGAYAVKRTWFTDQKVDYGTYEAAGMADMEMVRQPTQEYQEEQPAVAEEGYPEEPDQQETKPSANPFASKGANPFQENQANPFH